VSNTGLKNNTPKIANSCKSHNHEGPWYNKERKQKEQEQKEKQNNPSTKHRRRLSQIQDTPNRIYWTLTSCA
jgi:hypothetical protein